MQSFIVYWLFQGESENARAEREAGSMGTPKKNPQQTAESPRTPLKECQSTAAALRSTTDIHLIDGAAARLSAKADENVDSRGCSLFRFRIYILVFRFFFTSKDTPVVNFWWRVVGISIYLARTEPAHTVLLQNVAGPHLHR